MRKATTTAALAAVLALAVGCGQTGGDKRSGAKSGKVETGAAAEPADQPPTADATPAVGGTATDQAPPREYHEAAFAAVLKKLDEPTAGDDRSVMWLSFDGGPVAKGFAAGQSYFLCAAEATIPPTQLSPTERQALVAALQAALDAAGVSTQVTADKPDGSDFTTLFVGGSMADLGCSDDGTRGVAPFDLEDAFKGDVGFVFDATILAATDATSEDVLKQLQMQAGHVVGILDLLATANAQSGDARGTVDLPGFKNVPSELANLPGLAQIAGIADLLPGLTGEKLLDIDTLIPAIELLAPIGVVGMRLAGLDQILTVVTLAGFAANQLIQVADPDGVYEITKIAKMLDPTKSKSALTIANLATGGGFSDIVAAMSAAQTIIDLLGGGMPDLTRDPAATQLPQVAAGVLTKLPDLAGLLGIQAGAGTSAAILISNFANTTKLVGDNFTGAQKDALNSLVKVAYTQAWQKLLKLPVP